MDDSRLAFHGTLGQLVHKVETVAQTAARDVGAPVIAIRSEGFGGDFRSGYEDAFKVLMDLMTPRTEVMKGTINIIGAREGPTYTEWVQDLDELERLVRGVVAEVNGMPATEEWILGVAVPLGLEERARELIRSETEALTPEIETLRRSLDGKTALIEISGFPRPVRALSLASMAREFGAHPIIIDLHPYTIKERPPSLKYLLGRGEDPEVILTRGIFALGTFNASSSAQEDVAMIAASYDNSIYLGSPSRHPGIPQMNMTTMTGFPQYGYHGLRNIARLVRSSMRHASRPRSALFRQVLYGS